LVDRKGIDRTFRQPNCDSKFNGSKQNYEFIDTGFKVNEYEILDENGVLDDLEEKNRPSKNKYKSEAHRNYNYNLYVKHYSTYK